MTPPYHTHVSKHVRNHHDKDCSRPDASDGIHAEPQLRQDLPRPGFHGSPSARQGPRLTTRKKEHYCIEPFQLPDRSPQLALGTVARQASPRWVPARVSTRPLPPQRHPHDRHHPYHGPNARSLHPSPLCSGPVLCIRCTGASGSWCVNRRREGKIGLPIV